MTANGELITVGQDNNVAINASLNGMLEIMINTSDVDTETPRVQVKIENIVVQDDNASPGSLVFNPDVTMVGTFNYVIETSLLGVNGSVNMTIVIPGKKFCFTQSVI